MMKKKVKWCSYALVKLVGKTVKQFLTTETAALFNLATMGNTNRNDFNCQDIEGKSDASFCYQVEA
jgi:hypothetical protein